MLLLWLKLKLLQVLQLLLFDCDVMAAGLNVCPSYLDS